MDRKIIPYRNYFWDFYKNLDTKIKLKFDYVFNIIITMPNIPHKFFSKIENTDGLFEIRIEFESNIYRVFCFYDTGNLVILGNAFQKKTQKTPKEEILKAAKIKEEYFNEKQRK